MQINWEVEGEGEGSSNDVSSELFARNLKMKGIKIVE